MDPARCPTPKRLRQIIDVVDSSGYPDRGSLQCPRGGVMAQIGRRKSRKHPASAPDTPHSKRVVLTRTRGEVSAVRPVELFANHLHPPASPWTLMTGRLLRAQQLHHGRTCPAPLRRRHPSPPCQIDRSRRLGAADGTDSQCFNPQHTQIPSSWKPHTNSSSERSIP